MQVIYYIYLPAISLGALGVLDWLQYHCQTIVAGYEDHVIYIYTYSECQKAYSTLIP